MILVTTVLLALASYRVWRLIGADTITDGLRERLPERVSYWLGCHWCAGTWIALVAVLVTRQEQPVLMWLATATLVGLIGERA